MTSSDFLSPVWSRRWQSFSAAAVRAFHAYAGWLVGISWKRFFLLALVLLVAAAILESLPPFRWTIHETISGGPGAAQTPPSPPTPPKVSRPKLRIDKPLPSTDGKDSYQITIDEHGIVIAPRRAAAAGSAASAARETADAADAAEPAASSASAVGIDIRLPPGAPTEAVRQAVDEARQAIAEAVEQARQEAAAAAEEAKQAARESATGAADHDRGPTTRIREIRLGEFLPQLAMLWIMASAVIKVTYKRQIQAEAQAAVAVETAEAESLKRQVVEARMAAMQAQVEPHFLFNTLASIDHLIEVDPARASRMQKNLIALLRASMPTLREASDGGARELGREIAMVRPYLEILKVRMEERLTFTIDAPEGLLSAEFPPMMVQTLVENAIKHGLEPKPEGGTLDVKCQIVHGKLAVSVADTGVGFAEGGPAATAGTGVGLENVRERLKLLYGTRASLVVAVNQPSGVVATITLPYKTVEGAIA
jgi:hypothetical protein